MNMLPWPALQQRTWSIHNESDGRCTFPKMFGIFRPQLLSKIYRIEGRKNAWCYFCVNAKIPFHFDDNCIFLQKYFSKFMPNFNNLNFPHVTNIFVKHLNILIFFISFPVLFYPLVASRNVNFPLSSRRFSRKI